MAVIAGNKSPFDMQVAREIEVRIKRGIYKPGDHLPPLRALGQEFNVSLNVVQRAIRRLEKQLVVVSHAGKGVEVVRDSLASRSAILFGFIQPYPSTMHFERQVLQYAEQAFSSRENLMVVRSSEGDPGREVEVAKHFIHNGVQGILLWCTDLGSNARYFESIASRVPVVMVDRLIPACRLPAVVIDVMGAGEAVIQAMFDTHQRRRLLMLVDDLDISPYRDMMRGISSAASQINRAADVTIVHMPISGYIHDWNQGDFSRVAEVGEVLRRHLEEGGYDALFCQHEDFIDYAFVQSGLVDQYPALKLGTLTGPGVNGRSIRYNECGVLRWVMDFPRMIQTAAEILQDSLFDRNVPAGVTRIPVYMHPATASTL